jgi:hypothetical protein
VESAELCSSCLSQGGKRRRNGSSPTISTASRLNSSLDLRLGLFVDLSRSSNRTPPPGDSSPVVGMSGPQGELRSWPPSCGDAGWAVAGRRRRVRR